MKRIKKIKKWKLMVEWDNGKTEEIWDFPNGMNEDIEEWLKIMKDNGDF